MLSPKELKYLSEVADSLEWSLSDWMDDEVLKELNKKLLHSDNHNTWKKIIKGANNEEAFYDFYCAALDAWFRFENMKMYSKKKQKTLYTKIDRTLDKLGKLFKEDRSGQIIGNKVNHKLFDDLEQYWEYSKKGDVNGGMAPRFYHKFSADNWIKTAKEVAKEFSNELPSHPLLSAKRGDSGLIAFYTNSLCEVTESKFSRPYYEEIATIANIVLDTDKDTPVTGENVRMNYNNLKERLNKNRKILA